MAPLSLIVFAFTIVFGLGFVRIGTVLVMRAQAQNAADAAALAGAVQGKETAMIVAERNGAELFAFESVDQVVTVTVRKGNVKATATAAPISVQ